MSGFNEIKHIPAHRSSMACKRGMCRVILLNTCNCYYYWCYCYHYYRHYLAYSELLPLIGLFLATREKQRDVQSRDSGSWQVVFWVPPPRLQPKQFNFHLLTDWTLCKVLKNSLFFWLLGSNPGPCVSLIHTLLLSYTPTLKESLNHYFLVLPQKFQFFPLTPMSLAVKQYFPESYLFQPD